VSANYKINDFELVNITSRLRLSFPSKMSVFVKNLHEIYFADIPGSVVDELIDVLS